MSEQPDLGEILPEETDDDRPDPYEEQGGRDRDDWLRDEVPPHHGG